MRETKRTNVLEGACKEKEGFQTEETLTGRVPTEFLQLINQTPIECQLYVALGIILGLDLLAMRTKREQQRIVQQVTELSMIERLALTFRVIFDIEVTEVEGKLLMDRKLEACEKCGAPVQQKAKKYYGRLSEAFLKDLGVGDIQGWFGKHVYIQCWQCQNPRCKTMVGALRRKDMPYAINSTWFLDWMYRAYLGSGASLRVVTSLAEQLGRTVSPTFLWVRIQRLGRVFFKHLDHCIPYLSGIFGLDEVFPHTIYGKTGILAAIDQQCRLIVHVLLRKTMDHKAVHTLVQTLEKANVTYHTIITDLRNIYPKAFKHLKTKVRHVACILHIYRHLQSYLEKGLKTVANHRDSPYKKVWAFQLECFPLLVTDIFHSPDPVIACEKLDGLLTQQVKYGSNPGLKPFFKYLRVHRDLLIQTLYSWSFLINNNPIERFFGHIRHKLKVVRGWKTTRTLLYYVRALAIYRNFLQLQKLDATVLSYWTGEPISLQDVTFAEYLQACFPEAGVGSPAQLPIYQTTNWQAILDPHHSLSKAFN